MAYSYKTKLTPSANFCIEYEIKQSNRGYSSNITTSFTLIAVKGVSPCAIVYMLYVSGKKDG